MPKIHRSAIVEDGAELAADTIVGAYAYVGSEVKLGPGCVVANHTVIQGRTTLGENCQLHPGAVIGGMPQDLKYRGEAAALTVGDHNIFREHCTVHIGTQGGGMVTRIGSRNLFMAGIHVAHDCLIGDNVIMANLATLGGHVVIENGARVSGLAAIHQFVYVGRNAFISGGSMVVQDVPPFMIADGDPARVRALNIEGLKRSHMDRVSINALKEVFRLLYRSDLNRAQAIREIRQSDCIELPEVQDVLKFLELSERGRLGRTGEAFRPRSEKAPAPPADGPADDRPSSGKRPVDLGAARGQEAAGGNGADGDEDEKERP